MATRGARQTPPGARPNRGRWCGPHRLSPGLAARVGRQRPDPDKWPRPLSLRRRRKQDSAYVPLAGPFLLPRRVPCLRPSDHTYERGRLWITFWREFSGVIFGILGDFWEVTGPGASAGAVFSLHASAAGEKPVADLQLFAIFCRFLAGFGGFLRLFGAFGIHVMCIPLCA